jgi:multidrug efflux pump subunit AcrA (membrane-fusion protein)
MLGRGLAPAALLAAASLLAVSPASGATSELGLDFTQQGQLTRVLVRAGDHVSNGQLLAQIDPAQARNAVVTSEAAVLTARAQLLHETEGISRADRATNRAALVQAIAGVRAALLARADGVRANTQTLAAKRHAVTQVRQRLASARASVAQNALVTQTAVDQSRGQLLADSARLAADQAQLATDQAMTDASGQGGGAVAADESAIRNDSDAIRQDQNGVAVAGHVGETPGAGGSSSSGASSGGGGAFITMIAS